MTMAETLDASGPKIVDVSSSDSRSQSVLAAANENTDNPDNEKGIEVGDSVPKPLASPRNVHGFAWLITVASILLANFLFATDNTIAANIQPAVVKDFASLDKLAWLPIAFLASSWGTNLLWYTITMRQYFPDSCADWVTQGGHICAFQ